MGVNQDPPPLKSHNHPKFLDSPGLPQSPNQDQNSLELLLLPPPPPLHLLLVNLNYSSVSAPFHKLSQDQLVVFKLLLDLHQLKQAGAPRPQQPQQVGAVRPQFQGQRPVFQQPFQIQRPGQPQGAPQGFSPFTAFAQRPGRPQARPPPGFAVRPPPQGFQQRPEQFRTAGGPPARFAARPAGTPPGFSVFNPAALRGARF